MWVLGSPDHGQSWVELSWYPGLVGGGQRHAPGQDAVLGQEGLCSSRLGPQTGVQGPVDTDSGILRVCSVRSVDGSATTAFTVLECEASRRLGSRPRRYLLTGQANGSLAMWDLTTAMDGLGQAPGTTAWLGSQPPHTPPAGASLPCPDP